MTENSEQQRDELIGHYKAVHSAVKGNHERIADLENQLAQLKTNLSSKIGDINRNILPQLQAVQQSVRELLEQQAAFKKQLRTDISSLRKELPAVQESITTRQDNRFSKFENKVYAGFTIVIALQLLVLLF